jgi:hypothetical protein
MGASESLRWPITCIGVGAGLAAIGCVVELVEDQNVDTISQSISLPGLLTIVVGLVLVATGYSRVLRRTYGIACRTSISIGVGVGVATFLGSLWWQLTYGFSAVLEAVSVGLLLFGGAALVQIGCRFAMTPYPDLPARNPRLPGNANQRPYLLRSSSRIAVATCLLVAAVILLGAMAPNIGWLNNQVLGDPEYQVLAIEIVGSAAWWLGTGYSGVIDNLSPRRAQWTELGGIGAGIAFVIGGYVLWRGWSLYPELGEVILVLLTITGLGLCLLSAASLRRRRERNSGSAH